jgi:hypothetical protein
VSEVVEILALALAAAFWPVLLGVVIVALRASHPKLLLASFFAGAMVAAVSVGLVVVYALDGSSLADSSSGAGSAAEIVLGVLCIVAAFALTRRQTATMSGLAHDEARPGRLERALEHGAPLAFAAGVVLDLAPSPFALVAYRDIASFDIGLAETLAILIAFYVVALMFVEVPLVGFLVAPHWTQVHTIRFNAWLGRNWQRLAVWALGGLGVYLVVKGIVEIVT